MSDEHYSALEDVLKQKEWPAVTKYVHWGRLSTFDGLADAADAALEEMALELLRAQRCITARGELIASLKQTIAEQDLEIQRLEVRNGA